MNSTKAHSVESEATRSESRLVQPMCVSHILNSRYNEKKTTIITANFPNLPPEKLQARSGSQVEAARDVVRGETLGDRITERMRSRLHEMCRVVQLEGADFRQRVQSANFR
jgi:DNA replication protein DnaC